MAGERLYPILPELTSTPRVLLSSDEENMEDEFANEEEEFTAVESRADENAPGFPSHGRHVDSPKRWWTSLKEASSLPSVVSGLKSVNWPWRTSRMVDKGKRRPQGTTLFGGKWQTLLPVAVGVILAAVAVLVSNGNSPSWSFQGGKYSIKMQKTFYPNLTTI